MLKDIWRVHRMRKIIKKERKETGRCESCGKHKKCERWCWGPSFPQYIWVMIKYPRPRLIKWMCHNFKGEYHWAGVEPWRRYE